MLCDKYLEDSKSIVVKKRGIVSLVQASRKRHDKKHVKLEKLNEILIHKSCQTLYVRESNVKLAKVQSRETWQKARKIRNDGKEFDFSLHCFVCGNKCFTHKKDCRRTTKQSTVDNVLEQLDYYPKTEANRVIASRLNSLKDKDDRYYIDNNVSYHSKCLLKFYAYRPNNIKGRPIGENMSDLLSFVINTILENSEECQFSLKKILNDYVSKHGQSDLPRLDRIELLLREHFGDEVVIYSTSNDKFICFKRGLNKCLQDSWYETRKSSEKHEKLRIVEQASHIILQDIRALNYDLDNYNSPTDFLRNVKDIPETLNLFLETLIKTHKHTPKKGSWAKWENRILTAAHILISSVRPRSFISPILLGLSCMMHTKFAARGLIDCLSNIGLCASYTETVKFENSLINDPENINFISDTYMQFVYDNADHNTATIDGKNTFHCMGGIMCVSPTSSVSFKSTIPRLQTEAISTKSISASGFLPLTDFENQKPYKLDRVVVRDWKGMDCVEFIKDIDAIDFLYFYGKSSTPLKTPNWHGFMNNLYAMNNDFCTTKVIALPFIKAPPGNHRTILTSLIDARRRANINNQKHCFVTFDLPLYMKASEIVASIDPSNDPHNVRSVIPRLGGFHLLMSFLGSIGNIMAGSGLKEVFCTIYAELSADKALTGHAFSRSIRGHLLVQAALATILLKRTLLTDREKIYLEARLEQVGVDNQENILNDPMIHDIKAKFLRTIDQLEANGPTCQLWIQYFQLISLVQKYIHAERSGNFQLHLNAVISMIPFFFASGHHLYAKACLLYVQDMMKLENIMDIIEFDKFIKKGFFTIRRSNRFWCGTWSDMTIEQMLMRAMKCSGGLTHGRGLTENVIGKWVLSRIAVLEVGNAMESFSNMIFSNSEQHVDNRVSRIRRDTEDLAKIQAFFDNYNPFPDSDKIMSIYSGVIGDLNRVNCHQAFKIGKILMEETSNKKFTDVKYKRSSRLVHLAAGNSSIKNSANEEVYISPLLIFQKISLSIRNEDDIKEYCSAYELSTIPLSLFDENGLRKTAKSAFSINFNFTDAISISQKMTHVVDGGFFLHKVVWPNNSKIELIIDSYVSYAIRHYSPNSWIIFDGYPECEISSTKSIERSRRQLKSTGREIAFDLNTIISVNQKVLLSNEKNKARLINLLCRSLNAAGFRTRIAPEDADRLIVVTAIENASLNSEETVIIVGEDVDLLVIFSQLAQNFKNIYFRKNNNGSKPNQFYNSNSFKYPNVQKIVAFLHAFTGCDTTSCFYRLGKNRLINSFPAEKLLELSSVFYQKNASSEEIASSAYHLIIGMYSDKSEKKIIDKSPNFTLNDLRFMQFSKAKIKSKFSLESLPPTEGAAKQHAFRVYYQLQQWLGNIDLQATDWGWQIKRGKLLPVGTADPPIPIKLMNQIACSCSKKGCIDASCGCKKHGLRCTNLCGHCHEDTCSNLETNNSVECEDNVSDSEDLDGRDELLMSDDIAVIPPSKKHKKM